MSTRELVDMFLTALFGPREPDANRHHYLFGVEMPSEAEKKGVPGAPKHGQSGAFERWVRDDLRKQRRESYIKDL